MSSKKKRNLDKSTFSKCGVELSIKQQKLFNEIKNNTLTVVHGAAGTSKTFTSCYTALDMYVNKIVNKIIITKPLQESGNSIGHLPGTVDEKINVFFNSYISNFYKIIGKQITDLMVSNGEITIEPLTYMRGATYDDCVMLLDESQNCSIKELMLWSTRMGGNSSKMIMMGDTSQFDVRKRDSGFSDYIEMVNKMGSVSVFKFLNTDIVRSPFLIELTNRYDKYRSLNKSI